MNTVLEMTNITKKFGNHLALKNINMTIHEGEIYGLIGRNGAGKTTLLKLITQLIEPDQGIISLFGSQGDKKLTKALRRSGSVIETPVAYDQLSAVDNLRYYCKLRGVVNPDAVIEETLKFVNLSDTGKKKFKDFSLGMKQKLGIAIAILTRPDFLILDEPINGLDPLAIVEFRKLIRRLNQELGMTIIVSSHILEELYQVATRFGIIHEGVIVKEISKQDFDHLSQDFIILDTPEANRASLFVQEQLNYQIKVVNDGTIHIFTDPDKINQIIKSLVQENIHISGIHYSRQNLETYFTNLVSDKKEVL